MGPHGDGGGGEGGLTWPWSHDPERPSGSCWLFRNSHLLDINNPLSGSTELITPGRFWSGLA